MAYRFDDAICEMVEHPALTVPIAMPRVRDYIHIARIPPPPKTSIAEVQKRVAAYFDIPLDMMLSTSRAAKYTRPRQVAMYIGRKSLAYSYSAIGRRFKRDHATVMSGCRKIDDLIWSGDAEVADALSALTPCKIAGKE